MATLSVIRRWALREQMSIREISRRTGLARNTVKKYLRAGDEEPRYAKRGALCCSSTHPILKRRKRSTYPQRELLCSQKRVGQYSMEISGQKTVELNTAAYR